VASQSLALQDDSALANQPDQDVAGKGPEPSSDAPVTASPQEIKANFGLTPTLEKRLLQVWRLYKEDWSIARRQALRETLRHIEYKKGHQYISWDPFAMAYNIGQAAFSLPGQGNEQGKNDYSRLQCFNIIGWLTRNWISTFPVPGIEWWPGDSESDLDSRAAQARNRAYQKIEYDNKSKEFLEQCLNSLFLTGSYFRYIRWSMDRSITGVKYEPKIALQPKTIAPDRYTCPNCGTDNPANQLTEQMRGTMCMNCGQRLTSAHFYPATTIQAPTIVGQEEVPRGQVLWDVYNLLNVEVMPQANTSGGGVIANTPLLDLQLDWTKGALRRAYPGAWDLLKENVNDTSTPDGELSRIARARTRTPGPLQSSYVSPQVPATHLIWFTPDSIAALDKKNESDELMSIVTNDGREAGCKALVLGETIIDIGYADVKKSWTWCGAAKDLGANPPAPVSVAMPFQDSINDRINSNEEFFDRAGQPPILFSRTMIGEGLNGKFLPAGSLVGLDDNAEVGLDLKKAFFQPEFHQAEGQREWIDAQLLKCQLLCGIPPQTWGGSDPNVKTKGGQEQALKTAKNTQQQYWNQIRGEWAEAANLSVDCFADNAQDDEYRVAKGDDAPDFQNEPIRLADLAGEADARPLAQEDYPIDYDQQRAIFQQLLGMESGREPNPLVEEMLNTYENRRIALRYLAPADMQLPETAAHNKVLADIQQLLQSGPIPVDVPATGPDGMPAIDPTGMPAMKQIMKPTVEPSQRFDSLDEVTIPTVMRYAVLHYKELAQNQPGMQNLEAYFDLAVQYAAQRKASQALLSSNALGWQGKLGAPAKPGGDAGPVQ